jgi:predicted glutamine amidotransferase
MCQLLGMNCNIPTDICFSFTGFRARGGLTDHHSDGWGIAFFEGRGVRLFLDPTPSCTSPIADLVRGYPIKSRNVVAHIRKATQGAVSLENTHPFQRELWGEYWVFAHNGNLGNFSPTLDGSFVPVGSTDSEKAFCYLLTKLKRRFGESRPSDEKLVAVIRDFTVEIAAHGEFNFILSNGSMLLAHCSTRLSFIIRKAPFGAAHLKDQDIVVDFGALTTTEDRVAVVATTPLTENESWSKLEPGTLAMFSHGTMVMKLETVAYTGPVVTA